MAWQRVLADIWELSIRKLNRHKLCLEKDITVKIIMVGREIKVKTADIFNADAAPAAMK